MNANPPLLAVSGLKKHFPSRAGRRVVALDGVDLELRAGETLGVVGESGCGKSTLGRAVLRLIEPSAGKVMFAGRDVLTLKPAELRALRRRMQMVFQDPFASLDPRFTVARTLTEPLLIHGRGDKTQRARRVAELLDTVGLPVDAAGRYPHEFSGGQRQRISIARAIALEPELVVADEPVSALDVSIQAQILNLLAELRERLGLAYLFISHDLAVVEHVSDRVAVMYLGRIVEQADTETLFARPAHPYTQALLDAIPQPNPVNGKTVVERQPLAGEPPDPARPPPGCVFHPRCPQALAACSERPPPSVELGGNRPHWVSCHLYGDGQPVNTI